MDPSSFAARPLSDPLSTPATARYAKKRDAIVAAATNILNRRGVKGMTLADVAASVGLITTSVTYYFKKKEDLAAAVFFAGIARIEGVIDRAMDAPSPEARLRKFLALYLEEKALIRLDDAPPIPVFNDVRALGPAQLAPVSAAYGDMFQEGAAAVLGRRRADGDRPSANARTHLLMEQIYWAVVWLPRFEVEDYPRIRDRMADILIGGLAPGGAQWAPQPLDLTEGADETGRGNLPDRRHPADQPAGLSRRFGGEDFRRTERHQGFVLPSQRRQGRSRAGLFRADVRDGAPGAIGGDEA